MGTRGIPDNMKMGCVVFSMAAAALTLTAQSEANAYNLGAVAQEAREAAEENHEVHGFVNSEYGLIVREEPDAESGQVKILSFGAEVEGEEQDGWLQLKDGYISMEHVQDECPIELLGEWRVTAYASTGYPCANGQYPTVGYTIAQNTYPFGTKLYIEDVGVRTVEDRGPDWLGSEWCDLYLGDTGTCIQWGDQTKKVWLVK